MAAVDAEADMRSLRGSAAAAARTSKLLAARQSEALEEVTTELLCSPEIVRCAARPARQQVEQQRGCTCSHPSCWRCWLTGKGRWRCTTRHRSAGRTATLC